MLNEPSQGDPNAPETPRPPRSHPLEADRPRPTAPAPEGAPRQQIMLHIPTVQPYVVYSLLGIMIAIFVLRAVSPTFDIEVFLWGANHQPDVLNQGEFYRLFTSMFLHASIYAPNGTFALQNSLHLLFNAYILFVSGGAVERLFGHARFSIIFVLGGMTGSILSCVLGSPMSYSVGASGAVFAVLAAEFVYIFKHRKLLGAQGRRQMQSLITLAVFNLLFGILSTTSPTAMRIDNWAHLGGALGGLGLAWFIAPDLIFRRHPEIPNELLAEDRNPLQRHYRTVSLYVAGMLGVLIVASQVIG
jgi:rhomboid protease GluP